MAFLHWAMLDFKASHNCVLPVSPLVCHSEDLCSSRFHYLQWVDIVSNNAEQRRPPAVFARRVVPTPAGDGSLYTASQKPNNPVQWAITYHCLTVPAQLRWTAVYHNTVLYADSLKLNGQSD